MSDLLIVIIVIVLVVFILVVLNILKPKKTEDWFYKQDNIERIGKKWKF